MRSFIIFFVCGSALFFCQISSAHAQAIIALIFGGKMQTDKVTIGIYLAEQASDFTNTEGDKKLFGLAIGAYTNVKLSSKWAFCNYFAFKSPQGAKDIGLQYQIIPNAQFPDSSALIKRRLTYFELVPLMRYNITPSWGIAFGPRLAYRIGGTDLYESTQSDNSKLTVEYHLKDVTNAFDAGAVGDLQYSLSHGTGLKFNLRYAYNFLNVYKSSAPISAHNRYYSLGVGIPLGVKKQESSTTNK